MKHKAIRSFSAGLFKGERISFKYGQVYDLSKYPNGILAHFKSSFEEIKTSDSKPARKEVKVANQKVETASVEVKR